MQDNADAFIAKNFTIIATSTFPIFLIGAMTYIYSNYVDVHSQSFRIYYYLVEVTVLIMTIVAVFSIKNCLRFININLRSVELEHAVNGMGQIINNIRKQRHDFNIHLQTAYGLLENDKLDQARSYLKDRFSSLTNYTDLVRTDNHFISINIYSGMALAEAKGIDFELSVTGSFKNIPLLEYEITSLFGNLINNAIEAAEVLENSKKKISVDLISDSNNISIRICNTGLPLSNENIKDIFKQNVTSKGGSHHGLGLSIVEEIVNKYKGSILVSSINGTTVFTITLPCKGRLLK